MSTNDGAQQRRVLFLTPQMPFPPTQGTAIRNYHLLRQVARVHCVALLTFSQREPSRHALQALHACCERVFTVAMPERSTMDRLHTLLLSRQPDMALRLWSEAFRTELERVIQAWQPDIVQVEGIELGRYALRLDSQLTERTMIVFDDHNAEYLLQKRAALSDLRHPARWHKGLYSFVQWQRLRRFEAALCHEADAVLAVSDQDAAAIVALDQRLSPLVIPNGVDTRQYRPGIPDTLPLNHPAVVFTGKMDYRPNIDAVGWFADQVWPLVRRQRPDATFYVVGQSPAPSIASLAERPGIVVTGFVPEILPYFGGADVYVVPLRVGGGTRLKVLEAMAAGLPIVSTSLGAEGIDVCHQENIVLADDISDFAGQVLALLGDRDRAARLGSAARALVEKRYDWASITPPLIDLLAAL